MSLWGHSYSSHHSAYNVIRTWEIEVVELTDCGMKITDTHSCSISTCLIGSMASLPFPVLLAQLPKSVLNFSCSVTLVPAQHSILLPREEGYGRFSRDLTRLVSFQSIMNSLSPILHPPVCLRGPRRPIYSFCPAISPWRLYC